jgi:2-methylaconitate cis-trans-isomerase PrpF
LCKNSKAFLKVPCAIIRGGTSKGVFFFEKDLPPKGQERDQLIKNLMGTPDVRQINGLGGGDILTSKVAILGASTLQGADVDYTFAQVGIEKDSISYEGNCGNISAAVGPVAIESGMLRATEPFTIVHIHNTNVGKIIKAEVPVKNGQVLTTGDYKMDGVPGSGARIELDFSEAAGSLTPGLLSTGNLRDILEIPGFGKAEVSFVDLSNPVVFIRARDLGLKGNETPTQLEQNKDLIELTERIRGHAAQRLGFVIDPNQAFAKTPYVPFFCMVSPAENSDSDICSRLIGFKKVHKTFPGTGAVALAAASQIEGSVVHDCLPHGRLRKSGICTIAHPSGLLEVAIDMDKVSLKINRASFGRTWRRIMDGFAYRDEK